MNIDNHTFQRKVFGFNVLCCNHANAHMYLLPFLEETYDAGMTFVYNGKSWIIDLYSPEVKIDCEKLVSLFGGSGTPTHGTFETDDINKLFKKNPLIKL